MAFVVPRALSAAQHLWRSGGHIVHTLRCANSRINPQITICEPPATCYTQTMTGLNHALTGAAIALVVKRPILAIPLAFLSHFVIDAIPHWGNTEFYSPSNPAYLYIVGLDGLLALTSIIIICYYARRDQIWLIVTCAFLAMLPDAVWAFDRSSTGLFGWYNTFHHGVQWCERPWGIIVELFYATGMSYLIFKILQKDKKHGRKSIGSEHSQKV